MTMIPTVAEKLSIGLLHLQRGEQAEAESIYKEILRADSEHPEALHYLGVIAMQRGKFIDAECQIRSAIDAAPHKAIFHGNYGTVLAELGRAEEAIQSYRTALQLKPDYAEAHNNLGVALAGLGRAEQAIPSYRTALQLKPDYAEAHNNLSLTYLRQGRFAEGWPEYEYRPVDPIQLPVPRWRAGTPGDSMLLLAEQGLGDTLQFIRYAKVLKQSYGCRVMVAVQPPLVTVLQGIDGVDHLISNKDDLPEADCWAAIPGVAGIRVLRGKTSDSEDRVRK